MDNVPLHICKATAGILWAVLGLPSWKKMERVQCRATMMVNTGTPLLEEWLRVVNLCSLWEEEAWGNLSHVYKYLKGRCREDEAFQPYPSVILWQKSTMDDRWESCEVPQNNFFLNFLLCHTYQIYIWRVEQVFLRFWKVWPWVFVCSRDLMTKLEGRSVWMCSFLAYKATGGGCLVAALGLGKEEGSYLLHLQLRLNTTGNCLKQGYDWVISDISRAHVLQRAESLLGKLWETALSSVNEQKPKTSLKFLFLS